MTKEDKEISISNEWHQWTLFTRSLMAKCGNDICTGTHDVTEVISICTTLLCWWNESIHSSNQCVVEVRAHCRPSPTIWQQKVNNNTKCTFCPRKDALSTKMKVPKDTHMTALMLLPCFPFDSAIGSDKHSKIRYALLTKEWKMKKKSTKSEIVGESLRQKLLIATRYR